MSSQAPPPPPRGAGPVPYRPGPPPNGFPGPPPNGFSGPPTRPGPPPRPPVRPGYDARGPEAVPRPGAAPDPDADLCPLAVLAVVVAVLLPPVGLVLGVVARRRIARTRERGRKAATAAIALGAVLTVLEAAAAVLLLVAVPQDWIPTDGLSASSVASQIETSVKLPAGTVTCPGALPAQTGASVTCTTVQNGVVVSYAATVTTVDGRDVRFDVTRR